MVGSGDGAGQLSVPGCPTHLNNNSGTMAYGACIVCEWVFLHIFSRQSSLIFSFSLDLGDGLI